MAKKEQPFYVGMDNPEDIRKNILEATKDTLHFLQRYEKFKELRKEKLENLALLKQIIKESQTLVNKLAREFPKTKLRVPLHQEATKLEDDLKPKPKKSTKKHSKKATKKNIKKSSKEESKEEPEISDLEKLEKELGIIEKKLSNLS